MARGDGVMAPNPEQTYYGALNLTSKPVDVSPTMRLMPYTGKPVVIGEPDLNAGNGCKQHRKARAGSL